MQESDVAKINKLYGSSYTSLQDLVDKAVIIHYASGEKPWRYTFRPWAKEWYKYYMMSPYKNVEFKLRGIWSYRFDKMRKSVNEQGLAGFFKILSDRRNRKKKKIKAWE